MEHFKITFQPGNQEIDIESESTILEAKLNPEYIGFLPFAPVVTEPLVVNAQKLKININPGGKVFILPNIAGFVGADTVAVLLASELDRSEDIKLIVDIGTAVGAIDHIYYKDKLEYSVIGDVRPKGICGSALLDAVAGLVELGY